MAIITLLTDFGIQDEYVGVLKGVILGTDTMATIVDICHGIGAQDIVAAAHTLKAAYPYFPDGTVHVAVVDPGVGTDRGIIAAQAHGHRFIAPDNGLLAPVLVESESPAIYRVVNENLFRHPVSRTFHGRDIIAPVAARLSAGLSLEDVGPAVALEDIHDLDDTKAERIGADGIKGRIVHIDRFGNLMTNIHARDLADSADAQLLIEAGDVHISGLSVAYAQGSPGKPMALVGSRGTIEIAVMEGSAARLLKLARGAIVRVRLTGAKQKLTDR
jgi:S-adenosyl-L-methionine hydrolase (adenosine-forming)